MVSIASSKPRVGSLLIHTGRFGANDFLTSLVLTIKDDGTLLRLYDVYRPNRDAAYISGIEDWSYDDLLSDEHIPPPEE